MEYLKNPYLTIHWIENEGIVHMEWKTYAVGKNFRDGLDKGLELIVDKGSNKWLADLGEMQVVNQDDQEWSNENWFPRAISGGIRFMAIIVPNDVFAKMSVNRIMEKAPEFGLTSHYFNSVDEGLDWLKSS